MIRLGVCTGVENAAILADLGYDYLECGLSATAGLSEADFERAVETLIASPLRAEAFNGMVPGDIRLTGPEVNEDRIQAYLDKAFFRAGAMGGRVIVFGSGAARRVPQGFTTDEAWKQLIAFLSRCIPLCEQYGVAIAIEPLRKAETNILHTVREGAALAAAVDNPFIGVLGDSYHMDAEGEPLSAFADAKAWLKHVHVAQSGARTYPKPGDSFDYYALFASLAAADYEGRVSVEGRCESFENDARAALAVLRDARDRA